MILEWIGIHLQDLCPDERLVLVLKIYFLDLALQILLKMFFILYTVMILETASSHQQIICNIVTRIKTIILINFPINNVCCGSDQSILV